MKLFKKIAIVGVGLIGGSIGLAARKKKLAGEVVGVARREVSRRKALKFRAVHRATLDLEKAVSDADLVVIAAPVGKIETLARRAARSMKKGAILTDVGSSKRSIVRKLEKLRFKKINFVGSHPMTGSDRSGVENADDGIFNNASLVLTKTKKTDKRALNRLKEFWKALGCRIFVLSPEKHDMYASLASYLPHAVSYALSLSQTKDSVKLSAGSLKDTTRVASSDTELWKDIFLSAREDTLMSIRIFARNLKALEGAIKRKDHKKIKRILDKAKKIRDEIK
ncbi:MAG: prephenate dehydrogenase [Candidatus Omnitrophica bacterium]|nr:prephenate dehydrogenase [Candidatus Omnitrophota bacterium]